MKQHKKTCKGRIRGKQNNMSVGMSESEMMSEDLSISISECCCLEVQVTEEHAETRSFQCCPPPPPAQVLPPRSTRCEHQLGPVAWYSLGIAVAF